MRDKDRQTERERDRETDRDRQRQTERQTDRETERQTQRQRDRQTDRETATTHHTPRRTRPWERRSMQNRKGTVAGTAQRATGYLQTLMVDSVRFAGQSKSKKLPNTLIMLRGESAPRREKTALLLLYF